ncbi:hypothetical protein, partial [Vibrio ordalii]
PQAKDKETQADMSRIDINAVLAELNPWAAQYWF